MVSIRLTRRFVIRNATDLDAITDAVTDELVDLERDDLRDTDMCANLEDATIELSITARASSAEKACTIADAAIRTAIHAAGGATPGWRTPVITPTTPVFEQAEEDLVEPVAA